MLTFRPLLQHLRQPAPLHVWAQLHVPNIRGGNATLHSSIDISSGDFVRVSLCFSFEPHANELEPRCPTSLPKDSGSFGVRSPLNAGLGAAALCM
jgi:hypothetical protein